MVIWVTGLSGAGKTTLCEALSARAKALIPELVLLDGDAIRMLHGRDLGHDERDRRRQVERLKALAGLLDRQGLVVVVCAVLYRPDQFADMRSYFSHYFEVLIDAPLALVERRDPKGLYAAARRGEAHNIVGIDIAWTPPTSPDIVLNSGAESPDRMVDALVAACRPLRTLLDARSKRGSAL